MGWPVGVLAGLQEVADVQQHRPVGWRREIAWWISEYAVAGFEAQCRAAAEVDLDRVDAPRGERVDVLLVVAVAALPGAAAAVAPGVGVEAEAQAGGVERAREPGDPVGPLGVADGDRPGGVARALPPADVEPHVAVAVASPGRATAAGWPACRIVDSLSVPAEARSSCPSPCRGWRRARSRRVLEARGPVADADGPRPGRRRRTGAWARGGRRAAGCPAATAARLALWAVDTSSTVWLERAALITPITVPVTVSVAAIRFCLASSRRPLPARARASVWCWPGERRALAWPRRGRPPPEPDAVARNSSEQEPSALGEQRTGTRTRPLRQLARPTAVSPLETSGREGGIVTKALVAEALPPPLVAVTLHCRWPPPSTPLGV